MGKEKLFKICLCGKYEHYYELIQIYSIYNNARVCVEYKTSETRDNLLQPAIIVQDILNISLS